MIKTYLSLAIVVCALHSTCGLGLTHLGNGYKLLLETIRRSRPINKNIHTRWIEQPLDHFDSNELRVWPMRYFERLDLWRPGGPLYLFIGGEFEADPRFLTGGMIYELANETNGALLMSEHRYYGKSMPLPYTGTEVLKYLSARQALADISRLIKRFKLLPAYVNSKVVVVGGSYPGNLAAWMRLLYPQQVDAAIASSAPVLAKDDFYEYLETVTDVYEEQGGEECYEIIKNKFQRYSDLLKTDEGIATLKKEENICEQSNMSKPENQQLFVYGKSNTYMGYAQYGSEESIKYHCEVLKNKSADSYQKMFGFDISNLIDAILRVLEEDYSFWSKKNECWDVNFDDVIKEIREGGGWLTSWVYQMCTEFSYAKSTNSTNQIFSDYIPIKTFYKICTDSFGEDYGEDNIKKSVNYTNKLYGGLHPDVDKVIFVNGEMDPWHRLGILEDLSYDAPAKFIPRSSHCRDLLPNRKGDPDELVETRKYIKYIVKSWIGIEPMDRNSSHTLFK